MHISARNIELETLTRSKETFLTTFPSQTDTLTYFHNDNENTRIDREVSESKNRDIDANTKCVP